MTARWGSPDDRALGRVVAVGFLVLVTINTVVPGAEKVLNAVAVGLLVLGVVALVVFGIAYLLAYLKRERAIAWECVRPLDGLTDPDTGKPYRSPMDNPAPASGEHR